MRIAFITPRYGLDILGGAETLARGVVERLVDRDWSVEIWTTCARDYHTWRNVYPAGVERINGVTVRRFPALTQYRPVDNRGKVCGIIPSTPQAQYEWVDEGMNSPWLYDYLIKQGRRFDYLIFMPYPFGFICYSAAIYPDRSIIWPCLHDDVTVYFEPVRVTLNRARGIILNSPAEKELLDRLAVHNSCYQIVGYGLEHTPGDARRFHQRYPAVKAPFMLYAGRLEKSKNVHLLLEYFVNHVDASGQDLNLVLIGSGPIFVPEHPRIFTLGYVDEQDKHDAYAAATVLCQPSIYESFAITLLEAWLHETPVLVHKACPVTLEHCLAAQGGLYFRDEFEFGAVLDHLMTQPALARRLGLNGKRYVQTHYSWDQVMTKLTNTLTTWSSS